LHLIEVHDDSLRVALENHASRKNRAESYSSDSSDVGITYGNYTPFWYKSKWTNHSVSRFSSVAQHHWATI